MEIALQLLTTTCWEKIDSRISPKGIYFLPICVIIILVMPSQIQLCTYLCYTQKFFTQSYHVLQKDVVKYIKNQLKQKRLWYSMILHFFKFNCPRKKQTSWVVNAKHFSKYCFFCDFYVHSKRWWYHDSLKILTQTNLDLSASQSMWSYFIKSRIPQTPL